MFGITPSREQSCRTAEPVIITVHLTAFTGCFEVATVFFGAANADAQIAIDTATVANLVTVVITQDSAFLVPMTREKGQCPNLTANGPMEYAGEFGCGNCCVPQFGLFGQIRTLPKNATHRPRHSCRKKCSRRRRSKRSRASSERVPPAAASFS